MTRRILAAVWLLTLVAGGLSVAQEPAVRAAIERGIPTICQKPFGIFGTPNHAASDSYIRVVRGPTRGTPVLLPAAGAVLLLRW